MIFDALLLYAAPSTGTIGAIVAAAFFLTFIIVAYVAYKALRKTAKMGFRMAVVAVILLIAFFGSLSLWYLSIGGTAPNLRPPATRKG